ncbi:skin secretory protein xP2-like [Panicum virgatum]|uniref:Uncharacterized protein n=1 Tax=Panicum virgatum TaxID=38727 RepID=A0A8T0VGI3_PANVG|nr:skin secretory protein xP2-like [Panicum virgatum]KAG2634330.1 hypothetical protein PVAP13_2NG194000 [Panicum virgatum]
MGNCPPLPCPSPCPDVSFQDICANNNCHGCCIFHCNSKPGGVPPETPPRDFPPVQLRQLPHLPPPRPGSARNGATACGTGGVAQDVPRPADGYRFRPSPRRAASGSVPTERASGSSVAPPGVPGNGARPVPAVSWLAGMGSAEMGAMGHGSGVVRAPPLSWRTGSGSGSAGTAWATGRDDGCSVVERRGSPVHPARATRHDAGAAVPLGVPGNGDRPAPQESRWPGPGTGLDETGFTWHDGSIVPRHGERRAPPPSRHTDSGIMAKTTWATGRDTGAEALDMPVAVTMESGQDIGMQGDSSSPAPQGRLPLPSSSSFSVGRLSRAESRRRFPQASGTEDKA